MFRHEKSKASHLRNNAIEFICAHELGAAMDSLSGRLHNLKDLISPILDVAYKVQRQKGNINLRNVQSIDYGLWQSQICVNAWTENSHTENTVPIHLFMCQNKRSILMIVRNIGFYFNWRSIWMYVFIPGMVFLLFPMVNSWHIASNALILFAMIKNCL